MPSVALPESKFFVWVPPRPAKSSTRVRKLMSYMLEKNETLSCLLADRLVILVPRIGKMCIQIALDNARKNNVEIECMTHPTKGVTNADVYPHHHEGFQIYPTRRGGAFHSSVWRWREHWRQGIMQGPESTRWTSPWRGNALQFPIQKMPPYVHSIHL